MRRFSNSPFLICLLLSSALFAATLMAVTQTRPGAKHFVAARVQEQIFYSKALGRDMHYMIVLPVGYAKSQQRYPVVYLLHGWNGDSKNWVTLTNLVEYSGRYPMIIVTPDSQNSWYVNSATVPEDHFEEYIVRDLIPQIDTRWRTIASPHRRSIAGLSMGGYGSVLFGLKHPNLFAVVASISGGYDAPIGIERIMPELRESTERAYGAADSTTRIDNNVFTLLARANPATIPYFFLECGSRDPMLPSNRKFAEELSLNHVSYEYHEYPGAHTWEFWDSSLPMMLDVIATRIVPRKDHFQTYR